MHTLICQIVPLMLLLPGPASAPRADLQDCQADCRQPVLQPDAPAYPVPDSLLPWTHFRGSRLDGISAGEKVPVTWDDTTHIEWKCAIPGKGWSSPLVFGEQIWLTTAADGGYDMRAVCVDYRTGRILHNIPVFRPDTLYRKHAINSYATPTGAIEGDFVYVHYGRYGTACLERSTGKILWKWNGIQVEHIQGPGSSLLIHGNKLIVHLEGSDRQCIVALNKTTGNPVWITERPSEVYDELKYIGKKAYTTPIVMDVNGRELLISNGSAACIAYDPETGEEVWRIVQGEDSTISMPVSHNGVLYFFTSFVTGEDGRKHADLLAVDPDGSGNIGDTHIRWRQPFPVLQLQTPLVVNGKIYVVDSEGVFTRLDAESGEITWTRNLKGKFHSSPVYAGGYIYSSSTDGRTVVIEPGPPPVIVAENHVEGEIWATPAMAGGAILLRSSEYLYKIAY